MKESKFADRNVAYFSMEIGVDQSLPTYSGGLGVLAGDTLKAAADLKLPVVAVTMLYRKGYFHQHINAQGVQTETPVEWEPEALLTDLKKSVKVKIAGRDVTVKVWQYDVKGATGYIVPIYYLDTDIESNTPEDRALTDQLYGGGDEYRLSQEIVLGMGGVAILKELGHQPQEEGSLGGIHTYHMNEGHSALLTLALLDHKESSKKGQFKPATLDWVKAHTIFTTHTPVPAGHDRFDTELTGKLLGKEWLETLKALEVCPDGKLNMSELSIRFSRYVNGVAKRHAEVSREMFKGVEIKAVTNGIHSVSWTSAAMKALFDKWTPGWREDNNYLRYACEIPLDELKTARHASKQELFDVVKERTGEVFDKEIFTIGFARRAAEYKRGDLLFTDVDALLNLAKDRPLQIIFSGKAHPKDLGGKVVIKNVVEKANQLRAAGKQIRVIYLENYDMNLGRLICCGVDLWLNNPVKPLEASGTSGMKAALNGSPNLSTLDGWWVEGCFEGVTGWEIKDNAFAFGGERDDGVDRIATAKYMYSILQEKIMASYYDKNEEWLVLCRNSIAINAPYFNTQRMVQQYNNQAYGN